MQTLISVFDDRMAARKAVNRLVQSGFRHDEVHLREAGPDVPAPDRGVLDSLGRFFVSLFGKDHGERAAGAYGNAMERGHSVVIVDADDDNEAESAAVTLHECGAIEVEDRDTAGGTPSLPGVRVYHRDASTQRVLADQRRQREESMLSDSAGRVSREMKEDREER
ncbi:MAG TPA: hypothetical protein VIE63_16550, partial [Ramlibacter sp.]